MMGSRGFDPPTVANWTDLVAIVGDTDAAITARLALLEEREGEVAAQQKAFDQRVEEFDRRVESEQAELQRQKEEIAAAHVQQEAAIIAGHQALDLREKQIAAREDEMRRRVAALRAFADQAA
jgi:hypothetical protein